MGHGRTELNANDFTDCTGYRASLMCGFVRVTGTRLPEAANLAFDFHVWSRPYITA